MQYFVRDEKTHLLYETDADGEPVHGESTRYDIDDTHGAWRFANLDTEDDGEDYADPDGDDDEADEDEEDASQEERELISQITKLCAQRGNGDASVTDEQIGRLIDQLYALEDEEDKPRNEKMAVLRQAANKRLGQMQLNEGDVTPIANRIARRQLGVSLDELARQKRYDEVKNVYALAHERFDKMGRAKAGRVYLGETTYEQSYQLDEGDESDDMEYVEPEDVPGDRHTSIANKYARKLHSLTVDQLNRLGRYDDVRRMYDLASDDLAQRNRNRR